MTKAGQRATVAVQGQAIGEVGPSSQQDGCVQVVYNRQHYDTGKSVEAHQPSLGEDDGEQYGVSGAAVLRYERAQVLVEVQRERHHPCTEWQHVRQQY